MTDDRDPVTANSAHTDPDPPAETPTYVVNVDVAVRREGRADGPHDDADDEYLFIVRGEDEAHAPGTLGFPGGKVEAASDESGVVAATASREVREETGVAVTDVDLVTSSTFESDDGATVLNLVVAAEYAGGEAHPAAPDEVAAVEWRTTESVLADDDTPPWLRGYLEALGYRE